MDKEKGKKYEVKQETSLTKPVGRKSVLGEELTTTDTGTRSEFSDVAGSNSHETTKGAKQASPKNAQTKFKVKLKQICLKIVENKYFVMFTTALTIYALAGDDCRLLWTNEPADKWFDILTLTCLLVFSAEIGLSIAGKDDYFMGFFFILDVVSTVSLILDFSPVTAWMSDLQGSGDDDDDVSSLRSGRTARLGARAGRIVRVIRLVRILKLYKAIHDANVRKRQREERLAAGVAEDEDDWSEMDIEDAEKARHAGSQGHESRVGKKLSDMTTRRVIVLVLTMLLVFPLLKAAGEEKLATSGWYGADHVYKNFELYRKEMSNPEYKTDYEHALLTYIFFHNWYADRGHCTATESLHCADQYLSHLFWIGIMGPKGNEAVIQDIATKSQIRKSAIVDFIDSRQGHNDDIFVYGDLPTKALDILSSPWDIRCETQKKLRFGISLLREEIPGVVGFKADCPDKLRRTESTKFYTRMMTTDQWTKNWYMVYYFDLRPFIRTEAGFNLLKTGVICIVLCSAAVMFTNDANKLVLNPVANMIKRVEAIRKDPLVAMQMADEEFKHELIAKAKKKRARGLGDVELMGNRTLGDLDIRKLFLRAKQEPMETVILEKTIIKLGSLLALGFGEAGAGIVAHNMRGSDSAGVNAMVPGSPVKCILGLARIKNFSTANEVLKGRIMTFANEIAEIVHGVVNEYSGAPNKNNGDSFLLIWRMKEEDYMLNRITRMAELSVVSFARVIGALHHSPLLAEYRTHPGLQQRLGTGTRVNMSFGLHFGWAIEGAVGSEFKIDASYLSPNVSIVNGIEKATNTYGVPFLIAESVFELLGKWMQEEVRLIDRIILTGATSAFRLYSLDLDVMAVTVGAPPMKIPWNPRQRFKARQFLESEKAIKLKEDYTLGALFMCDPNVQQMRKPFTVAFKHSFNMGYQNYSQGEWPVARRMLLATQTMLAKEDGPSTAILRFMEQHQFRAPFEWVQPGYRDLDRTVGITTI